MLDLLFLCVLTLAFVLVVLVLNCLLDGCHLVTRVGWMSITFVGLLAMCAYDSFVIA